MINKKSQIAIILLFPLAIVLSLGVLFAMASFNSKFDSQSENLSQMMFEIKFNELYAGQQAQLIFQESISSCQSCSLDQIKQKIIQIATERENLNKFERAGNLYAKFRNSEFEISQSDNLYNLKINSLFVQSERGYNKMQRAFSLEIKSNPLQV